jgi:hypothetical protein
LPLAAFVLPGGPDLCRRLQAGSLETVASGPPARLDAERLDRSGRPRFDDDVLAELAILLAPGNDRAGAGEDARVAAVLDGEAADLGVRELPNDDGPLFLGLLERQDRIDLFGRVGQDRPDLQVRDPDRGAEGELGVERDGVVAAAGGRRRQRISCLHLYADGVIAVTRSSHDLDTGVSNASA